MLINVLVFLQDPGNRALAGWVGGGIVAVVGGLWSAYKFFSSKQKKPQFKVTDARIRIKRDITWGYFIEVTLINGGDKPDVLYRGDIQLYNRRFGFIDSVARVWAAKAISANSGQVLPIECLPRVTYEVQGHASTPIKVDYYEPHKDEPYEHYILRCTFVFGVAKPITIRAATFGLCEKSSLRFTLEEFYLRLRTGNKESFHELRDPFGL